MNRVGRFPTESEEFMKYSIHVTEAKNQAGNVRGFANLVFGDSFKITNIAILENKEKWQKKVYDSMVLHLDAAIDKVEDLSRNVELDRMEKKQIDKPEQVTDIRDAMAPVSSVAEPTEYQYGAEAFEVAYPKMDSDIMPEAKAPSVPKTGKVR